MKQKTPFSKSLTQEWKHFFYLCLEPLYTITTTRQEYVSKTLTVVEHPFKIVPQDDILVVPHWEES